MKKLFTAICLALVTATALAIPAKKGLYTTLKLDNGTEVRAQLCGDEHLKFTLPTMVHATLATATAHTAWPT